MGARTRSVVKLPSPLRPRTLSAWAGCPPGGFSTRKGALPFRLASVEHDNPAVTAVLLKCHAGPVLDRRHLGRLIDMIGTFSNFAWVRH